MFAFFVKFLLIISYFYLLSVFKRGKLEFFRFCLGSVGMFLLLLAFIDYATGLITYLFTEALGWLGTNLGLFTGYSRYGMFFVDNSHTVMSLYMDLECSGLIEMMVFTSLTFFFPVYKGIKKLMIILAGNIAIFFFNIIRVFGIIIIIYSYGSRAYAFAHSIFGRLIFYFLVITLYFCVFTKGQLNKQNIGNFSYEGAGENDFSDKKYNKEEVKDAVNKQ